MQCKHARVFEQALGDLKILCGLEKLKAQSQQEWLSNVVSHHKEAAVTERVRPLQQNSWVYWNEQRRFSFIAYEFTFHFQEEELFSFKSYNSTLSQSSSWTSFSPRCCHLSTPPFHFSCRSWSNTWVDLNEERYREMWASRDGASRLLVSTIFLPAD